MVTFLLSNAEIISTAVYDLSFLCLKKSFRYSFLLSPKSDLGNDDISPSPLIVMKNVNICNT